MARSIRARPFRNPRQGPSHSSSGRHPSADHEAAPKGVRPPLQSDQVAVHHEVTCQDQAQHIASHRPVRGWREFSSGRGRSAALMHPVHDHGGCGPTQSKFTSLFGRGLVIAIVAARPPWTGGGCVVPAGPWARSPSTIPVTQAKPVLRRRRRRYLVLRDGCVSAEACGPAPDPKGSRWAILAEPAGAGRHAQAKVASSL